MGDFEFLLARINVALPRDVQTFLDRLQILDYRTRGSRYLVQYRLVGFDFVAYCLYDYGIISSRQKSFECHLQNKLFVRRLANHYYFNTRKITRVLLVIRVLLSPPMVVSTS